MKQIRGVNLYIIINIVNENGIYVVNIFMFHMLV